MFVLAPVSDNLTPMVGATENPPTPAQRRRWFRLNWLNAIQQFADTATQQTHWLNPDVRDIDYSCEGCLLTYFEECLNGEGYEAPLARGDVNQAEVEAVAEFHRMADAYKAPNDDYFDSDAICADPNWQHIVALAQEAQRRLKTLISDPTELAALLKPAEWQSAGGGEGVAVYVRRLPEPK